MASAKSVLPIISVLVVVVFCGGMAVDAPYQQITEATSNYILPILSYDSLSPYIDNDTLAVHYGGHHMGYTRKLNYALTAWKNESGKSPASIVDLLQGLDDIPKKYRRAITNYGGGFVNHNFYWAVMSPNSTQGSDRMPSGEILEDIKRNFGSYANFKEKFTGNASSLFGSGYVWLCRKADETSTLVITTTANQDSPISEGLKPILVIDVWEHAYYLKHKNKRGDYITDWWLVVDWDKVKRLDDWWKNVDVAPGGGGDAMHASFAPFIFTALVVFLLTANIA